MKKKFREQLSYEAPTFKIIDILSEEYLCVTSVDSGENGHEDYDSGEMSLEDYD